VLEAPSADALLTLAAKLDVAGVAHKLWVEQPEGVPTALAAGPALKSALAPHFKKMQLCKAAIGGGGK
jgi:hypothetical protein